MQISIDTYAYTANAPATAVDRKNKTKKNAGTDIKPSTKTQAPVSAQPRTKAENAASVQKPSDLVKNSKDETTFPAVNLFTKYEKYFKVLNEHYSKVNEENKKFANPEKHINDKYYNKKSPYYIEGLTQREREICVNAERDVLRGVAPALNGYDPIIQEKFGGCNIFMMDMEYNQDVREDMNAAVNQAFQENGITIPEGTDLKLTVDPYDFYIHADGVEEELARKVEEALNKGKNGYYLYYHISYCNPANYGAEEPSQYHAGDGGKMAVYHLVDRLTGYDIRELEHKDGKFYTPDGQDLWKVLTDKYNEMAASGDSQISGLGEYYAEYRRLEKEGWNSSTDSNLTIEYKNGSLYDTDTSHGYGPGQTAWQDRVRGWYEGIQEAYRAEREETLRRERNTPAKLEAAIAATEQLTAGLGNGNQVISDGENGFFQLTPPNISKLQELLDRLQKDGMLVALTDKVFSLREEPKEMLGFDRKA